MAVQRIYKKRNEVKLKKINKKLGHVIRISCMKATADETLENCNRRLCGNQNETISYIASECSRLVQKNYKNFDDRMGRVVHGRGGFARSDIVTD